MPHPGLSQPLSRLTAATLMALCLPAQAAQAQPDDAVPNILVWGRGTDLLGEAASASDGLVGNADFSTRPLMRVGELVEVIPGMIATQHSGPGKANQYFLRGMNLDHGSDFAGYFEGMPINQRSHAHASGYLDLNFIIPEIVETVEFSKGTHHARNGDFSAAGAARFRTYDQVDRDYVEVTLGNFDHRRLLGVGSTEVGRGTLLMAGELQQRDGPWELPQNLEKVNLFSKYSANLLGFDSQISFSYYDASWTSTDQIPRRAVESGELDRFGFVDPDLGGESSRISLIGNFRRNDTDLNLYYSRYKLDLYNNSTYFMEDPVNGDEFVQQDRRNTLGGHLNWGRDHDWQGRTVTPELGLEFRYDDVGDVALIPTRSREPTGVTRHDSLEQLSLSAYAQVQVRWTPALRSTIGVRGEHFRWDVNALRDANDGSGNDDILLPKFTTAWTPVDGYELYASYGESFHSNDVRGAETSIDPVTGEAVAPVDVLVRAEGAELGLRGEPINGLNFTAVAYWMELESELLFSGDAGTSEPNDPTRRRGVELSAFWEVNDWLVLDGDATWNRARFIDAPAGSDRVPDAHETTASFGVTLIHPAGITTSLRGRHFGDAPLNETASAEKSGTTLVNLGVDWPLTSRLELGLDILNLLDEEASDIEYYFASQLPWETEPVEDHHFHPVESRAWRAMLRYRF